MLAGEDLGVEITISLAGCSFGIGLSANLDLCVGGQVYVLRDEGVIERIEVEGRIQRLRGRERRRGRHRGWEKESEPALRNVTLEPFTCVVSARQ